jgi:mannose-6-phosphate isomerase
VWNADADRIGRGIEQAVRNAKRRSEDPAARWMTAIAALYPGDAGVLAPLYLNLVSLAPGEAMYLGAGELHSYLEGTGIEIMGNSDNVLRGGLTAKHVDIRELCRVLRFESHEPEVLLPREISTGERVFETSAQEFELAVLAVVEDKPWRSAGPRGVEILLATEGEMTITDRGAGESYALARGASVLIPNSVECYELTGAGIVYRAGVPKR